MPCHDVEQVMLLLSVMHSVDEDLQDLQGLRCALPVHTSSLVDLLSDGREAGQHQPHFLVLFV